MSARDESTRDSVGPYAEQWVAESPYVGEAEEEQVPIHPWYQSHTPFVEGRELEVIYGSEAEWESELAALGTGFERQVPPAPPPTTCGFHGPNGVFVTETDLRTAVRNVALDERKKWLDNTIQTLQKEDNPTRFGDIVRYWLAGLGGKIHPGKLEAVQQAALDPSITYGNLGDATLNAAIQRFGGVDKKVNDGSDDVYKRSAVEDSARAKFKLADAARKTADAVWKAADAAVKRAEARVRGARGQSRSAAQAALDTERAVLGTATTEHSRARKDRDAEKKNLDEATRALATAKESFRQARDARKKALKDPDLDWKPADRRKIRKALLAKAAGTDPQNISDIVDEALRLAHRSRADVEAWSAVFVVSCVRTAAIGLKLEAMNTSGAHVGKDGQLKASIKHAEYVVEARERKRKGDGGTYHAFEPRDPVVQIGDIICTDRTNFIGKPVSLQKLKVGTELHCDIVTSIESENGKPVFAETIGGNVRHTVRRRRYPLDSQGRLVVSAGQLFAQEEDDGTFLPFEMLDPVPTTMLAVKSTGRILALLSPACKPASAPTGKGAPTGKEERFLGLSIESLESPFLDEEILPTERRNEFDSSVERLADESPFVGTLEERRSRFDEDQLEKEGAPIHPWYQGYTLFVEGLEEMYAPEAEWEAHLTALETENPFGDASEQDQTTLSEPEELEEEFVEEDESAWERDESLEDEADAYDEVATDPEGGIEELYDEEAFTGDATSLEEELLLLEEVWIEPEEEGAYSLEEAAHADEELAPDEELFIEHEEFWRLLSPGVIMQRVQQLLGEGVFNLSLLGRFASGQIWNEDHLALEILFHRQPRLRPAELDTVPGSRRLKMLHSLAVTHQRELTPIRERIVRPIFGNSANFQVGSAEGCQIQDLRKEVRKLGPLYGGTYKGKVYYKRAEHASPRKKTAIDSIVLHHMAFNIGNDVNAYKKVGAHYIVTADGQIAQLYDDLDFLNASDGFNPRSVAIEFAGNFSDHRYHWWKSSKRTIPDRCYLTPTQIRAGRCLLATLKNRLPDIKYLYAHRQSSKDRAGDPGPDVWFNIGEWALTNLNLTDRLPRTHIGTGQPIPDNWRMSRPAMTVTPIPDKESFVEPEEEVDWETSVSEQSPTIPAGVAEFAVTLGKEWAKQRNGIPSAEKITEWLLQDYQDTLEGARKRWGRTYTVDAIGRAWMISRQDQMKFQTSSSAGVKPLLNFQPPTDSVGLVSNKVIKGSDQAPVAPILVRFVEELRRRYRGVSASTYPKHGGGKFDNRGYSIDLWLKGLDDRGFYPPGEAVKFLRALHEAARATNAEWRVIYNDFSVADTINRETGQEHVIFVGKARQDKNKKITGLNWHGPHPLILHFHLDLVPGAGAPNARVSVPSATTTTSTSKPIPDAAKPPAELVRFAQRVLNATEGERLVADGIPGPRTSGALERFRRKYNLGAGGMLDDKTQLALAQRALEELAQQSTFEKGKRDLATDQALSEFKTQRGLGAEPTLDAATRAELAEALERRVDSPGMAPVAVTNWSQVNPVQRMRYVMGLLVNNYQYPENGAAGIVGNLWAESDVLPNRVEGSKPSAPMRAQDFTGKVTEFTAEQVMNRRAGKQGPQLGGIGLAQWTAQDRRAGLFNHTFQGQKLGANILYNMDAQVDYLVTDLQTRYRHVHNVLSRANVSLEEASDEVVYNYEIPSSILTPRGPDGRRHKLPRNHPAVISKFKERRSFSRNALRAYQQPIPG